MKRKPGSSVLEPANGMDGLLGMRGVKVVTGAAAAVLLMAYVGLTPALADTIEAALVRAYQNNPQLNAQRASVRSTDENVPQALSGYRPKVSLTASAGYQYTDSNSTAGGSPTNIVRTEIHGANPPRSAGLTSSQTVFNGQQTANKTRVAESQVSGAREALRALEQTVLLQAATIYMDYLRDSAIVEVQRSNVRVLEQTLLQRLLENADVAALNLDDGGIAQIVHVDGGGLQQHRLFERPQRFARARNLAL